MMDKSKFIKRDFADTLKLLCIARGGEFVRAGRINQSTVARAADVDQSLVSRWLTNDKEPGVSSLVKLKSVFGVSVSQLLGDEPISRIDSVSALADDDIEFIRRYEAADEKLRAVIRAHFGNLDELVKDKG